MKRLFGSFCLCGLLACAISASAVTVTFEDLKARADADNSFSDGHWIQVPSSYDGLGWSNFWVSDAATCAWNPCGYRYGEASGTMVAYNAGATPAWLDAISGSITLHSAYLTGAWNDGLNVQIKGYRSGVLLYNTTVNVSAFHPTLVSLNYNGVDDVMFSSWGGTNAGFGGSGEVFVMDNLSYDVYVPEPTSILALLCGIGSLAGIARRRPG